MLAKYSFVLSIVFLLKVLLFPSVVFSQAEKVSSLSLGLNAGLNVSKFNSQDSELKSTMMPYLGLSAAHPLFSGLSLEANINYAIRRLRSEEFNSRIGNHYIDFMFAPRINIFPELSIQSGMVYSYLLGSRLTGSSDFRFEQNLKRRFDSEFNLFAGVGLQMLPNIGLTLNYTIRLFEANTSNFQIGLTFALNNRRKKPVPQRVLRREASLSEMDELKNGMLLVRLKTSDKAITALQSLGQTARAESIREAQLKENRKIVAAFRRNFDFSNVRFFYSFDSDRVRSGDVDSVFLNDNLEFDTTEVWINNGSFFGAEFSNIENDSSKFFSSSSTLPSVNSGGEQVSRRYYGSMERSFYALRILDHNFNQLAKPFPYYTRAMHVSVRKNPEQLIFLWPLYLTRSWSYNGTVRRMNKKLWRHYR